MKKSLYFLGMISLMLVIGFTVIGCGGGAGSPSSVVKQLHTAIEKGDADKINELMTPEAASMILMFGEKAKGSITEKGKISKTEEKIDGDKATVKVTYDNGNEEEFELVKLDGKWKVSMEK
jgi:ketosteroid isomerase-like protein